MPQAALRSITTLAIKSHGEKAGGAIIDAFRRLISPAIFGIPSKKTILVPVADDRHAPYLRCGEFAVVETSWVEPADGVFVYRRGSQNKLSIVRLHLWTEQEKATIVDPNSGPYWSLVYGLQRMGNWQPSDEHCAPTGMVLSADGPLCDRYLREEIVGRVIGVLGDEARTLNWRA